MKAYGVLYASVNVQDRKALEKQWSRLYRVPEIQDAVNNLLEFEVFGGSIDSFSAREITHPVLLQDFIISIKYACPIIK